MKASNGRFLRDHDGVTEWSVCGKCGTLIDWANDVMFGRDSGRDRDDTSCPRCGHADTAYLYDESAEAAVEAIREAYDDCQGAWSGCDWTTDHGTAMLDLDGITAADARERVSLQYDGVSRHLARIMGDDDECQENRARELLAEDWESAAEWLDECERRAADAEEYGQEAMEAAERGDFRAALDAAKAACSQESEYGDDPIWSKLRHAIEEAMEST